MAKSLRVFLARLPAVYNVACRISIMPVMILVVISRARFAKMERAAWVVTHAMEEISNPSRIRAMENLPVATLGIMVQSAI